MPEIHAHFGRRERLEQVSKLVLIVIKDEKYMMRLKRYFEGKNVSKC